jgi:hypothetical protein
VTVGQEKRVTQWDLRQPDPIAVTDLSPTTHNDEALTVAVSHSGSFLVTGGTGQVRAAKRIL